LRMLYFVCKAMGCWMMFLTRMMKSMLISVSLWLLFNDYAYLVPYVETDDEIFLKTVIPSRKATKQYFGGNL